MLIVVNHKIIDYTNFWESATRNFPLLPGPNGIRLIQMLPNLTLTEIIVIWEATTIASLDLYLRRKFFDWSIESYYELNLSQTIGFP